ncbi:MAG: hypothetical protein O2890_06720 [Cyanobacteria bacterium]|nr:hypothetical protein [Cyanobacteriota bacterium]MDA0866098.1 hypothetical protein [Cyanobacteriota bacterium]
MHNIFEWQPELGLNHYASHPIQDGSEIFVLHQMAQALTTEVRYREALHRYYDWYAAIAHDHQVDLEQMRAEPQLLKWFPRQRP